MDECKKEIIRDALYSPQARETIEEDRRYVDNFNRNADMINKQEISTPIKKKQYRYRYSLVDRRK